MGIFEHIRCFSVSGSALGSCGTRALVCHRSRAYARTGLRDRVGAWLQAWHVVRADLAARETIPSEIAANICSYARTIQATCRI